MNIAAKRLAQYDYYIAGPAFFIAGLLMIVLELTGCASSAKPESKDKFKVDFIYSR